MRPDAKQWAEAPAPPEPLNASTVDAHCHLDLFVDGPPEGEGVASALKTASAVGVDRIVQVGVDVPSSKWALDCANAWPGRIVAAVALHPNDAPIMDDLDNGLNLIDQLAAEGRVRAIGETGLDYFRTAPELQERQRESFRAHIEIAKRHNKALMIHDRDAHEDVLRILREEGAPERVVFHCFSGDAAMARDCVAAGYVLSFSGTVTFKNAKDLQGALLEVPATNLLVETDAPFLAPTPYRGRSNAPHLIPLTLRFMAEVRDEGVDQLASVINGTAEEIFGVF